MLLEAARIDSICLIAILTSMAVAAILSRLGFPLPAGGKRVGCIDGLRGFLALSVFLGHSLIWNNVVHGDGEWRGIPTYPVGGLGNSAVPIFFMITGMLFYPRAIAGVQNVNWIAIYITRFFRIIPLVTVSFACISLIIWARYGIPEGFKVVNFISSASQWISSWAQPPIFAHEESGRINAYVLWSLKYEWCFYLAILPMIAIARSVIPSRTPNWVIPFAMLAVSLLCREFTGNRVIFYLPLFAVGMLTHEIINRYADHEKLNSRALSATALASIFLSAAVPGDGATLIHIILNGLFFIIVASGNDLFGILRSKAALVLGECSFGIYVLHGIVLSQFPDGLFLSLPALSAAIVLVTACTYLTIERPFIAYGARLARRTGRRPTQLSPATLDVAP